MPSPKDYKDALLFAHLLDAAWEKEKTKYERCPVEPDAVANHVAADAWGFIVVGYLLLEESLKALRHLHGQSIDPKHSLTAQFKELPQCDKDALREYYSEYLATTHGYGEFPFETLDAFLTNLDGERSNRGDFQGSVDWRYFLIENKVGDMPSVSIEVLHEVIYGCVKIVQHARGNTPGAKQYTRSWRCRNERLERQLEWLLWHRQTDNSGTLVGKLVILHGPDYRGRYDTILVDGSGGQPGFKEIPPDSSIAIVDKRAEFKAFDAQ